MPWLVVTSVDRGRRCEDAETGKAKDEMMSAVAIPGDGASFM